MGCYRLGLVRNPDVPLAQAIAASAAFPPFLSPLTLHLDPSKFDNVEGADLHDRTELKRTVALSDGGVYDNLGLETVSPFHTILSSDAGGALSIKPGRFWSWPSQVSRVIDTATEQARALRRRRLADELLSGKKEGAFWRTSSHLDKYPVAPAFPVHPSWRGYLASLPTRLAPFSDDRDRYRLVNWGYLVADVALRSYVTTDAPPPLALPFLQAEFSEPAPASQAAVAGDDRPTTASEVNE
jgi:NTE family protein